MLGLLLGLLLTCKFGSMRINDVIEKYSYKCVDYLPAVRYTLMPLFKRSPTPHPLLFRNPPPPRRRGVGAPFSSSRAADNTATTATNSHTNDNGSTTGTSRIGGFSVGARRAAPTSTRLATPNADVGALGRVLLPLTQPPGLDPRLDGVAVAVAQTDHSTPPGTRRL